MSNLAEKIDFSKRIKECATQKIAHPENIPPYNFQDETKVDIVPENKRSLEAQIKAAESSIEKGFAIFPTKEDKHPFHFAWKNNALTAEDDLISYFSKEGDIASGHAVLTGTRNNIVVFDLDPKNNRNIVMEFRTFAEKNGLSLDTFCVASPSGGMHYYYRNSKSLQTRKGTVINGLDILADKAYVVGPGSFAKSKIDENIKPYRIRKNVPILDLPENVYDFLVNFKPEKKESPKSESDTSTAKVGTNEQIEQLITDIANSMQGTRNDTLNKKAYEIARLEMESGTTDNHAQQILDAAIQSGLSQDEAEGTIKSAYNAALAKPVTPPSEDKKPTPKPERTIEDLKQVWDANIMTCGEMLNRPIVEVDYLIKNIHENHTLMLLAADPKTGKGFFSLHMLLYAALAKAFLGLEFTHPCKTLYLTAEETQNQVVARVNMALKQFTEEEKAILNDNFKAISIAGEKMVFMDSKGVTKSWELFCEMAKDYDFVVLDSYAKLFAQYGTEYSNKDGDVVAQELEHFCKQTQTSVCVIAHTVKSYAKTEDKLKIQNIRGAGATAAASRTILMMTKEPRKKGSTVDTVAYCFEGNSVAATHKQKKYFTLGEGIILAAGESKKNGSHENEILANALLELFACTGEKQPRKALKRAYGQKYPSINNILSNSENYIKAGDILLEQRKVRLEGNGRGQVLVLTSDDIKDKLKFK